MSSSILKPVLKAVDITIGIFTPSHPAHVLFADKYRHGIASLENAGFRVKEGALTKSLVTEGYRTASGKIRADEIMELICDEKVDVLMANIGGLNTSSILPYLNYDTIRSKRKLIVGYSDLTSLHMAVLTKAGLSTCYGPAVTPSFGEWPKPDATLTYFRNLLSNKSGVIETPELWSNTFRDYNDGSWCRGERNYQSNNGWRTIENGEVEGNIVIANLSTLLSIAGTPYFPELKDKILFLEDADASVSMFERRINQLKSMGVLEKIKALVFSKLEFPDTKISYSGYEMILKEYCQPYGYPLVSNFDCGHTTPLISLSQNLLVKLKAGDFVSVEILEDQILYK